MISEPMPVRQHREWESDDPLVLVGFPSQGLVGAIVASYLVPKLDMELVASIHSSHLGPVASVREGRALSPIQVFASTTRCGIQGNCDQLVVVRSDAAPPPEHSETIAESVLAYADEIGAKMVTTLEGAPIPGVEDDVFAVPNLATEVNLEAIDAQPFPDGSLSGFSASLLVKGNAMGSEVLCLFTAVDEEMPDAKAAARLVNSADQLVPGIQMEAKQLQKEAEKFEANLRRALEEQEKSTGGGPEDQSSMMYG